MFQLELQAIHTGASAQNKEEAIRQVAAALTAAGNVAEGYVNGMLAREQQTSTFLGNGIAIPHGTTDTRDLVQKTGCRCFSFRRASPGAKIRLLLWQSASRRNLTNTWRCCVS